MEKSHPELSQQLGPSCIGKVETAYKRPEGLKNKSEFRDNMRADWIGDVDVFSHHLLETVILSGAATEHYCEVTRYDCDQTLKKEEEDSAGRKKPLRGKPLNQGAV